MLGVVYIFGRMLEVLNSDRARNGIALLTAFPTSWWLARIYDMDIVLSPEELWWRVILYALIGCVLYVLVGFKLFDRVDHFFDKRFAPDQDGSENPKSTPRKKKPKT